MRACFLKYEALAGVRYGMFVLDYASMTHPYLAGQHRLSFEANLGSFRAGRR